MRAWTRLPSGLRLDLLNPLPDAWTDEDLAIRLARTYRWAGESMSDHPLSVAQHSIWVLDEVRRRSRVALAPVEALRELLHDAEEGFLGFDCISPLKAVLGKPFDAVSHRLSDCIAQRYGLPAWTDEAYRLHKAVDIDAAALEAVHVVGWPPREVRQVLGLPELPVMALAANDIAPWAPRVAAGRFLRELRALLAEAGAATSPTEEGSAAA